MTEANFASLNPGLLARKGGAKPAMRPQLTPISEATAPNLEDLGWNDMGDNDDLPEQAQVLQLTPATRADQEDEDAEPETLLAEKGARAQLREVETRMTRQPASKQGRRAAFTLRLDPQRHLKLKLASTITETSAQQLVTQALDRMLDDMPELSALAAQVKRP